MNPLCKNGGEAKWDWHPHNKLTSRPGEKKTPPFHPCPTDGRKTRTTSQESHSTRTPTPGKEHGSDLGSYPRHPEPQGRHQHNIEESGREVDRRHHIKDLRIRNTMGCHHRPFHLQEHCHHRPCPCPSIRIHRGTHILTCPHHHHKEHTGTNTYHLVRHSLVQRIKTL